MSPTDLTDDDLALRAALGRLADAAPPPRVPDLAAATAAWRTRPPSAAARVRTALARRPLPAAVVALAAVVLAVVTALALLPVAGGVAPVAPPVRGEQGLPARWWTPPAWTPTVLDAPIESASVALSALDLHERNGTRVSGVVLVSADGREYRRLPWVHGADDGEGPGEGAVGLSADGRSVAWAEYRPQGPDGDRRTYVHLLRLADGRETVTPLAAGGIGDHVERILWSGTGDSVLVVGGPITTREDGDEVRSSDAYRLATAAGARPELLCRGCGWSNLAALPDGRFVTSPSPHLDEPAPTLPGAVPLPADQSRTPTPLGDDSSRLNVNGASEIVALPDGSGWVGVGGLPPNTADDATWRVGVVRADGTTRRWPFAGRRESEAMNAEVVAASPDAALIALTRWEEEIGPGRPELIRVDLGSGAASRIGLGEDARTEVVGVAAGLAAGALAAGAEAGAGTVPGAEPSWPWYGRERFTYLLGVPSGQTWFGVGLVLAGALAGTWFRRRRARRPGRRPSEGPGSSQDLHSSAT